MNLSNLFDPINNNRLFGYDDNFNLFKDLILKEKLPKVILLSGEKGTGKSSFVNHFLHYYFDKEHYDEKNKVFNKDSSFHNQYKNYLFPNTFYLRGINVKNIKIEEIRNLKNNLLKTPIVSDKRFIIFDDVDTFNLNTLNALLRIIEEPNINNHFFLINNKSQILLDTIKSRCVEFKIIFKKQVRQEIISSLMSVFNQKNFLDSNLVTVSPGNFLRYNSFFQEKKITFEDDYLTNFKNILNFYKKDKDLLYKELLIFFTEYYFQRKKEKNTITDSKYIYKCLSIHKNINDFFIYNLSQNTLLNSIENKIYE